MDGAQIWLRQAKKDFEVAKDLYSQSHYYASAFFCQQAAEKALKAIVLKGQDEVPRSHDIFALSRKLKLAKELQNCCIELTPLYAASRYPDAANEEDYTQKDCARFIECAEAILKWAEKQL